MSGQRINSTLSILFQKFRHLHKLYELGPVTFMVGSFRGAGSFHGARPSRCAFVGAIAQQHAELHHCACKREIIIQSGRFAPYRVFVHTRRYKPAFFLGIAGILVPELEDEEVVRGHNG